MIAHKTSTFFFDFKNDSPALSNWRNSSGGAPNKLNHSLMCGFPPIPNCAKLLTPHGTPWRRAENPPAEVGTSSTATTGWVGLRPLQWDWTDR